MVRDSGKLLLDKLDAVNPGLDIDGKIASFLQSTRQMQQQQQQQQQQTQFLQMIGITPAKEITVEGTAKIEALITKWTEDLLAQLSTLEHEPYVDT